MTFEYNRVASESARLLLQSLPKNAGRVRLQECVLAPRADCAPTRRFPITFEMPIGRGFWKPRVIPRLERRVGRDMFSVESPKSFSAKRAGQERIFADKEIGVIANHVKGLYPSGRKLTEQARRYSSPYDPIRNGKPVFGDFSVRCGCSLQAPCLRVNHPIRWKGLHGLIKRQLARRGDLLQKPRFEPQCSDGYV